MGGGVHGRRTLPPPNQPPPPKKTLKTTVGVGDAQTVGVEILCYEIDNREQTAMLKKSFGMYQDEEFKESRIPWDKVEMGLKMASPYIPDFMGLKAGLNLVSEVPTVMKMLAKADKNDLVVGVALHTLPPTKQSYPQHRPSTHKLIPLF